MFRNIHSYFLFAVCLMVPVGLTVAGCSKGEAPPEGERMGGPPGGSGGRMGGPGGGGPIAATATAAEIFGQKCQGCHGEKGEGRSGPSLMHATSIADEKLYATIHDGKGRMPEFGSKMTEAQVKDLVAYVKKFGA
ncbi:cytochrome c [bacterium]|nr:MAG: cytochrome c [bacterium]